MRNAKLRKKRYESAISQIEKGNIQSQGVLVIDNSTGETKEVSSRRKGAKYVNLHHSYIKKCIRKDNI